MVGSLGCFELIFLVMTFAALAIPAWAIVDAAPRSNEVWQRAGHSKALWILLCALLLPLAAVPYAVYVRPRLKKAEAEQTAR